MSNTHNPAKKGYNLSYTGKQSNEKVLLDALAKGDRDAFEWLVERYQAKVLRTCTGFVHSKSDADDIAQEVFIEVFRSVGGFRGQSDISTWIYRIAVNKSLNFLRSKARRKVLPFLFDREGETQRGHLEPVSDSSMSPEHEVERDDQRRALDKALASLPEKQRIAFVLHKYDDLSYKEVAGIMEATESSVESLIFRARQSLQKKLFAFYKKDI